VAVGLRWNLDLLPAQARIAQAEAQLEEMRALERYALGGIGVEVENAYASALEAQRREEAWATAEKRARRWISTVQGRIDLGTLDERALTEPLRVYVGTRLQHNQALMDMNITLSELARVTGWDALAPHG
jgi:outer membrane protein TolC